MSAAPERVFYGKAGDGRWYPAHHVGWVDEGMWYVPAARLDEAVRQRDA